MNTDSALDEAILDSELHHINFFNGRLLTGGDLEDEQRAQHAHSRHLGEAVGEGVAFGLQVTPATASPPDGPVVAISKGLAVNRAGQTLRLECEKRIALTRPADPAARDACIFTDCDPAGPGATLASGTGYYVLTIGPASRPDGKAPVSGLGNTTAICNSRYSAEGVKFSVFRLNLAANATALARSILAQACFGLAPEISSSGWPGSLPAQYGLEKLVPAGFERDYNVPLAVFEWTNAGTIGFVKRWPVRRRMVRPSAVEQWAYFTSERRVAEGEAMFLDFQEDLAAVGFGGFAGDRFSFLPPGGVLPGDPLRKISGTRAGFGAIMLPVIQPAWKTFLGPLAPPFVTPIDASLWSRLLRDTFTREPVVIPAKGATTFDIPSFAAIKVYAVPDRAEWLFARSPLGRLRIFPGQAGDEFNSFLGNASTAITVIIRDANGCLRVSVLDQTTTPLIADDLPGGTAEIWFFLPMDGAWDRSPIDSGATIQQPLEQKSTRKTAKKKSSSKTQARAAAPAEAAAVSVGQTVSGDQLGFNNSPSLVTLLGQWRFSARITANIVNGRTTDIKVPSEQPNPPGGLTLG